MINDSWLWKLESQPEPYLRLGISAFGLAYDPGSDKSIITAYKILAYKITAYKITAYKNPIEVQPKNSNLAPFTL